MNPAGDGLTLRRHYEGAETWLEIVDAKPVARFSAELLRILRRGDGFPDASLDGPLGIGAVLHIRARNGTVAYRLTEHDNGHAETYVGEWPD